MTCSAARRSPAASSGTSVATGPPTPAVGRAGPHQQQIRAHRPICATTSLLGALADRQHRHHRADADDDAEQRQHRAEELARRARSAMRSDSRHDRRGRGDARSRALPRHATRRRCGSARASAPRIAARSRRRVISMTRLGVRGDVGVVGDEDDGVAGVGKLCSSAITSAPLLLSSAPVGSSARMIGRRSSARGRSTRAAAGRRRAGSAGDPAGRRGRAGQQLAGAGAALVLRQAGIDGGHLDVLLRRGVGQKIVALEDEAEGLAPQPGQLVGVEPGNVLAVEQVLARWSAGRGSRGCSSAWSCPSPTAPMMATNSPA